jgi:Reverse transcriptase (RNA-dependent DNA polymerase)
MYNWVYSVYGSASEVNPQDIPTQLEKPIQLLHYVNANLYHDRVTDRSVTGILQVDYVYAFAQADLKEDVFIEMPRGYSDDLTEDCVQHLNKSPYGLPQAHVKFFELMKDTLRKLGLKQ